MSPLKKQFVRGVALCFALLFFTLEGLCATASAAEQPLWCAAWITDTQTSECQLIEDLCRRLAEDKPSMIIHTGDTRFEWANQCAWHSVVTLMHSQSPPIELHLVPGNHDIDHGIVKPHLRRAASRGVYRIDTGQLAEGKGDHRKRVTIDAVGDEWPVWNPEVVTRDAWQPDAESTTYRYVFRRGNIRFIVCDCYYSDEQRDWVRNLITQPDDSSVSILLQHECTVDRLAKYFEGLEGKHNVKLVLTGHRHEYMYEERHGVTFITSAGVARGHSKDCDAMTLRVYPDRLQLDRYLIPEDVPSLDIQGPDTIWTCEGEFTPYERPKTPAFSDPTAKPIDDGLAVTLGPNLIYNGDFDNGIWYERFRGWTPGGWYQWFTCGDDAPEHAVGKDKPHSGKEYVRIHMWAHAWRGGILQNVHNIEPCHQYRLRAYGWFAKTADDPQPHSRIGLDPCGKLREQYSVDVTRHPAPAYNECVGDDPKTPDPDWPDIPETTVWSPWHDYFNDWGRFEVAAEACSDVMTVILYCDPRQRGADKPIYEMNWDSVSLYRVPWPRQRIADYDAVLAVDERLSKPVVNVQPKYRTAQVTWRSKMPAGVAQVVYRFLDSEEAARQPKDQQESSKVHLADYPFESKPVYESSTITHWIEIDGFDVPDSAVELQVVALSRAVIDDTRATLCSPMTSLSLK